MGSSEPDQSLYNTYENDQLQKVEMCVASAREVLTVSCQVSAADIQENWYVILENLLKGYSRV